MGMRECIGCLGIDNFFSQPVWREKGAEGWKGALEFHTGKILAFPLRTVRKGMQQQENGKKS